VATTRWKRTALPLLFLGLVGARRGAVEFEAVFFSFAAESFLFLFFLFLFRSKICVLLQSFFWHSSFMFYTCHQNLPKEARLPDPRRDARGDSERRQGRSGFAFCCHCSSSFATNTFSSSASFLHRRIEPA